MDSFFSLSLKTQFVSSFCVTREPLTMLLAPFGAHHMAPLHYVKPVALPIPKALPIHRLSEGVINAPAKQIKKRHNTTSSTLCRILWRRKAGYYNYYYYYF